MTEKESKLIPVYCPKCAAGYELTAADRGQDVECACGYQFVVPESDEAETETQSEVTVLCPSCASVYQLEREALGENVECQCGQIFVATETVLPEADDASLENGPARKRNAGPEIEAAASSIIRTLCPECSAEYELEADVIGEQVECACGSRFVVTAVPPDVETPPVESIETTEPPVEPPATLDESTTGAAPSNDVVENDTDGTGAQPGGTQVTQEIAQETSTTPERASVEPGCFDRNKTTINKRQPSRTPPLIIAGCCGLAVTGITLVWLFSGDDPKQPEKPRTGAVASQGQTDEHQEADDHATETIAEPLAQPVEEKRLSLAERLAQARDQKPNSDQSEQSESDSAVTAPGTATQVAAVGQPRSDTEMTDNPNELTGRKDFVIGSPATVAAASTTPDTSSPTAVSPPEPSPAASPGASERNAKTDVTTARANGTGSASTPDSAGGEANRKPIPFVTPRRVYRRFKDAATAGFKQFASMRARKAAASSGSAEELQAWQKELADTGGLLKTALQLVDDDADPQRVLQARLVLAFCYLEAGHTYEAGILAHAIARWTPADLLIEPEAKKEPKADDGKPQKTVERPLSAGEAILAAENAAAAEAAKKALDATIDPAVPTRPALEAASLALAAFVKAYQDAPKEHRGGDFRQIIEVAELFESKFPANEKLDSIRLYAGDLHQNHGDLAGAADWYARVSDTSPNFARSRLQAGQILWSRYLEAVQQRTDDVKSEPTSSPTSNDQVDQLKQRALQYLSAGVDAAGDDPSIRNNIVVAKLTLAQSHLEEEKFEQAVEALTSEPSSVTSAIGEDSHGRPEIGIRSVAFARLAYTTLIKAHLGAKQLDQAQAAMETLSRIAGKNDPAALAQLHLELSSEMSESYTKLAAEGQEDIDLLATIAASLEQVSTHAASLSPASLIRAAEAASELADSVSVQDDAQVIYGQAAKLYEAVLKTELSDASSKKAIRFRLAATLGKAGQFEESLELYSELLTEQPNIFDAQFAAARTLQAWAESENSSEQFVRAITGLPETPAVWGWARLSLIYQRLLEKADSDEKYRDLFLKTRLHIAQCRLGQARQMSSPKNAARKTAELEKALRELSALARTSSSFDNPTWMLLDHVFREIQNELNRTPQPLFETSIPGQPD